MRILYAAMLLVLLLAVGYALDLVDVGGQMAAGALEAFGGIEVPAYSVAGYVKGALSFVAAGLFIYIIVRIATALRGEG